MNIRKNARDLSRHEITEFLTALKKLKDETITAADGTTINHYDVFGAIHLGVTYKTRNGKPLDLGERNGGHRNAGFLSWHREFILRIEKELQRVSSKPSLSIPYWDWTDVDTTLDKIFVDHFMGPNGTGKKVSIPEGTIGRTLQSGPFAKSSGWIVDPRVHLYRAHNDNYLGDELCRNLNRKEALPEAKQIDALIGLSDYKNFRNELENGDDMHDSMHLWVRGSMLAHSSTVDPIFLMNHANVDRIWALWQSFGHSGNEYYPSSGEPNGHNLNDPMWPWDGGSTGIETRRDIWDLIPRTTDVVRPADILDCTRLGYGYVGWSQVKEILDSAIRKWTDRTGVSPDLSVHEPEGTFGWNTKQELLDSTAFDKRLVDPSLIGNNSGIETNLVKVLQGQLPQAERMPKGGPFLSNYFIAEIAHWIDCGTPD